MGLPRYTLAIRLDYSGRRLTFVVDGVDQMELAMTPRLSGSGLRVGVVYIR